MRYFIVVLALAGVILSSITLWIHYSGDNHEAISKSSWNSGFVNRSSYAVVAGVPVALFGIVGYALLGFLAWFRHRTLTAIASMLGLAYALYLTNIEAHILNVWCVYCLVSLFVIVLITLLAFGQLISLPKASGSGGSFS
jgi:vitamin-K-epoxide reductase (warfarin-sensitive)